MIEAFDLAHPAVPPGCEGLTILHLTDFHVRRPPARHRWFARLVESVASVEADLIALTGDYMDAPGDEAHGLELLAELSRAWRLRPGGAALGTFGNHDTPVFRRMAAARADELGVHWIGGQQREVAGVRVLGLDYPEDFGCHGQLAASVRASNHSQDTGSKAPVTPEPMAPPLLTLAHEPTVLIPGAQLGLPIIFCGHTHGGQVRLSPRFAPYTSSDTPPHLAAGVLRLGETLCAVSRGVGDGVIEGLRFNCPRQVPLYTLRRDRLAPMDAHAAPVQQTAW
jgi:predicted MPP superfamily phosphohydrolase